MGKKEKEPSDLIRAHNARELAKPEPRDAKQVLADWGMDQQLTAKDIVIPRVLSMQAMSGRVTDGSAKMGEFVESLNNTVLGDEARPVEFIPFLAEKVYVVMEMRQGKFAYAGQVTITPENEDHEFEVMGGEDGSTPERWYRTTQVYVLLTSDLDGIPYLLSFRSSSARAGAKILTTMYMKNIKAGKTPASMVMDLSSKKTKNDKGTFMVMDVTEKRVSTDAEIANAFEWVKLIKGGRTKVDNSVLEEELAPTPVEESEDY